MRDTAGMYAGVDIGATKTLIAFECPGGEFIEQKKFSTPSGFDALIDSLREHLHTAMSELQQPLESIVIAAPGTIEGRTLRAGGNVSWSDEDILSNVGEVYGDIPAGLINDAAAAGLYEAVAGAGRGREVVLYVTIGTGIGSSIITDGTLAYDFANSEGGRLLLDWQTGATFEQIGSGQAFVDRYGHHGSQEADPDVWREYGTAVGSGLFSMITVIRPSIVVVGGSMGEHFDAYRKAVQDRVAQCAGELFTPPPIVAAEKPNTAVAHGCITRAREIAGG
ncbi:hypothetical protein BRC19_00435 [Candidatus Saccharibacteria bacterium QS_5_54_17]|nr:MAG: hypothetical protein BRC19_00435 [Candidatus Saccharibacteria bacterium QS_5_54_17]